MSRREKGYQELHFDLFPGIFLDYFFCDGPHVFPDNNPPCDIPDALLINHCYRGGFEALLPNGKLRYRGEGASTLSCPTSIIKHSRLPQAVYEGISLCFILRQIPNWLQQLFKHMDIDIIGILRRYNLENSWFCVPENKDIQALTKQLYQEIESGDINLLQITALSLLNCVARLGTVESKQDPGLPLKSYRVVHKICQKMEDPAFFNLSLSELVAEEGIRYPIFQKLFKEFYYISPAQYRRKHRLSHGAFLLKSTQLSVMEIAALCGYDNASKFSSAFKKFTGLVPLAYKRRESIAEEK